MKITNTEEVILARRDSDGNITPLSEDESKWLNVYLSHWNHKEGQGKWLFTSRGEHVPPKDKEPDAVVIVAVYKSKRTFQDCLVLTSEYRVPILGREIGFPAGIINPGEDVKEAAKREFSEETGLNLDVRYVSPPTLYSSAGCTNETVQIVFGKASGTISYHGHESSEDIDVILANYQYISGLVEEESPIGAKAWPILFMYRNMGRIFLPKN